MNILIKIAKEDMPYSPLSRVGNNIVDYFTFTQRLETKGKYDVNFYEFVLQIDEFKKKKFIQTMFDYYEKVEQKKNREKIPTTSGIVGRCPRIKNQYVLMKEVYNICISAINIMKPLNCIEIFKKYGSKNILNFCAGWGGSTVASCAMNADSFIGIEINSNLKEPYQKMTEYLNTKSSTKIQMIFEVALNVDYSTLYYDTVFASPPYYSLEKYENNVKYDSKKEMNELFYRPLFRKTFDELQKGGYFLINICQEVYDTVLKEELGEAIEFFPLKKSKRQNNYKEIVYVWIRE